MANMQIKHVERALTLLARDCGLWTWSKGGMISEGPAQTQGHGSERELPVMALRGRRRCSDWCERCKDEIPCALGLGLPLAPLALSYEEEDTCMSPRGRSLPLVGLADWLRLVSRGEVREFREDRRLSLPLREDAAGNPKTKSFASLMMLGASKIFALPGGLIEVVRLKLLLLLLLALLLLLLLLLLLRLGCLRPVLLDHERFSPRALEREDLAGAARPRLCALGLASDTVRGLKRLLRCRAARAAAIASRGDGGGGGCL